MKFNCLAHFNGAEYKHQVECDNIEQADHAFQQHLYMTRFLTKDCARGWLIIDSELKECDS